MQAITDEDNTYDLIILGGGSAGLTAGIYGVRAGLRTLLLTGATIGGQIVNSPRVDNYPGFVDGIDGASLAGFFEQQAVRMGVECKRLNAKSMQLQGETKTVVTRKEAFYSKAVIIATGAAPRKLGIPGEDDFIGAGVSYCATCDGSFFKGRTVAIVGGGDTALSDAAYMAKIAEKVYIVHRRDRFRAAKTMQDAALQHENVEPIYNSIPKFFVGNDTGLNGLHLQDVQTDAERVLSVGGVFVAVGNQPQTEFLEGQVLLDQGYIVVDGKCRTNLPGVFAAGDVCQGALRQVVTAAAAGAVAGSEAAQYVALEIKR